MAEDSGQEKTEEPSAKRLQDAREKGQVARSKELTTMMMLIGSAICLLIFGDDIITELMNIMGASFQMRREDIFDPSYMMLMFIEHVSHGLWVLAPIFVILLVAAVAGSVALSGWNFSTKALAPKMSKLSPLKGVKKMVGPQAAMELVKALLKFFLLAGVGIFILWGLAPDLMMLGREPLPRALAHAGDMVLWAFLAASSTMVIVAVIDAPFQAWNNKRQLKMTHQEVRQEHKDTDGSPEMKQKVRQTQMDMAARRMMADVPDADVIITNPTHYSVAIKYDQKGERAPVVVAKGMDHIALEIRRIALETEVPILSAPPLARAVYHSTELDEEIPEGLYLAVAQVLAYVYQLKNMGPQGARKPLNTDDFPIPDDMRRDN